MFEGVTAYPLSWPMDRPRTKHWDQEASRFGEHSLAEARDRVLKQLELSDARSPIISTNVPLRKDGLPRSGMNTPGDVGVAVYFSLDGQPMVMTCDKWLVLADNLWAIAKALENMRWLEHSGIVSRAQLFRGFEYIPPKAKAKPEPEPKAKPQPKPAPETELWWEILNVPFRADFATVRATYLRIVKQVHPDVGGSHESFLRVQNAWDLACKERGWAK